MATEVKITPIDMTTVADWSRALWITASVTGSFRSFTLYEVLVLARIRSTLMILSQTADKEPTPETVRQIADRAAGKMRSVAG